MWPRCVLKIVGTSRQPATTTLFRPRPLGPRREQTHSKARPGLVVVSVCVLRPRHLFAWFLVSRLSPLSISTWPGVSCSGHAKRCSNTGGRCARMWLHNAFEHKRPDVPTHSLPKGPKACPRCALAPSTLQRRCMRAATLLCQSASPNTTPTSSPHSRCNTGHVA